MSCSACSECDNNKCPYKVEDHYDCYIEKIREAKQKILPADVVLLKTVLSTHKNYDFIDDEINTLAHAICDILLLLDGDDSNGGQIPE